VLAKVKFFFLKEKRMVKYYSPNIFIRRFLIACCFKYSKSSSNKYLQKLSAVIFNSRRERKDVYSGLISKRRNA